MQRDEADAAPKKPKHPCVVCGVPTDVRPICERWHLCMAHLAEWFEDPRFRCSLDENIARTPGWIADMKRREAA